MPATNPFPDGFCRAGVCLLYGWGPEEPTIGHAVQHLIQEYASWSIRRKHGLVEERLSFLDRRRFDRKVSLLRSLRRGGDSKTCPCDEIFATEGATGIIDTVEDMPNWTAWFGERVFTWFLHAALRARIRGACHGVGTVAQ